MASFLDYYNFFLLFEWLRFVEGCRALLNLLLFGLLLLKLELTLTSQYFIRHDLAFEAAMEDFHIDAH